MAYMPHIENLYRPDGQLILLFREVFALEKIHGTNCKLVWKCQTLQFFSGGESHEKFIALFDQITLKAKFVEMFGTEQEVTIYGEWYGGKQQGMSHTYGPVLKFIVFDVKIDDNWLDVPKAEKVANDLGLEFVHYVKIPTTLKAIDAERDAPSVQAIRNGISKLLPPNTPITSEIKSEWSVLCNREILVNPRKREGIVLRPLIELTKNNGARIICKHKGDDFKETKTPRPVVDPSKIKVLENAQEVADEYVTAMRLQHVLDKLPGHCMEEMKDIIAAMQEDVLREGAGEIVDSKEVRTAIGKKTAVDYKKYLQAKLKEHAPITQ